MISRRTPTERARRFAQMIVLPFALDLVAISPTMAQTDGETREEFRETRKELRELSELVSDLQSVVERFVHDVRDDRPRQNQRSASRDEDREGSRGEGRISVEQLRSRAQKAELGDRETLALLELAERADLNPRRFERLLTSDDLNDIQASAALRSA